MKRAAKEVAGEKKAVFVVGGGHIDVEPRVIVAPTVFPKVRVHVRWCRLGSLRSADELAGKPIVVKEEGGPVR